MGLVGYLSFRNGRKAVNDVASQLQVEISDRVQQYLKTYLVTPNLINRLNVDSVSFGNLNLKKNKDALISDASQYLIKHFGDFTKISVNHLLPL